MHIIIAIILEEFHKDKYILTFSKSGEVEEEEKEEMAPFRGWWIGESRAISRFTERMVPDRDALNNNTSDCEKLGIVYRYS